MAFMKSSAEFFTMMAVALARLESSACAITHARPGWAAALATLGEWPAIGLGKLIPILRNDL